MAFLFRNKPKSNMELTKSTKELTIRLAGEQTPNPKVGTLCTPPATVRLTSIW
jgi:calcium binding protein 39